MKSSSYDAFVVCSFKYWGNKHKLTNFVPPTRREDMSMEEFCERLAAWKPGQERLYMQQELTGQVGEELRRDFLQFKWAWLNAIQVNIRFARFDLANVANKNAP